MQGRAKWIVAVVVFVASVAPPAGQSQPEGQFGLVSTIAFSSTREDPACTPALAWEIFLTSPDGTNVQRLTDNDGCTHGDSMANLSPDGKKVVFDSNRLTANTGNLHISDLFLMKSDGTDLTLLTRGSSATWSPDGKYIAFHASASFYASGGLITLPPIRNQPGAPTVDSDIFVVNVDDLIAGTAVPRNITNSPDMIDEDADWSPDGTKIVFTSDPVTDGIPVNDYPAKEIYVMNADGTGLTRLTSNGYEERGPAWSPDGNRITFIARVGTSSLPGTNFKICVLDADGTNLVQLTDNALFEGTPTWSPDGRKIVFHRANELWILNADTACNAGACTCSAMLSGSPCEVQITDTVGFNLLANWGVLRVYIPGDQPEL